MSAANIALVQSLYAAFGRGETDTIVAAMAGDVRWEFNGRRKDYPLLGLWNGQAGVREFFKQVAALQEAKAFTPKDFHAAGDLVFVFGHYTWTIRKTGKPVDSEWLHAFTVKNGKVTAFREFTDTAQYAEAWRG
jgi:ketosteroid isomerase-like protein